jgi:vancomycin aglycone glucosyltransferase
MRVLLSVIGTRGDVQPLAAVASRLRAAGQEARLCVPEEYCAWVEGLGFPATPIGPVPWRRASASGPRPDLSPEQVQAAVAEQSDVLSFAARDCDVIVAAAVLPAARSVAELLGIGYVFVAVCPLFLPSPHHAPPPAPAADQAESFNGRLGLALNRHRKLAGLDPVDDVFGHVLTSRPWLSTDPVLGPWPGGGDRGGDGMVVQTGAWVLDDDRRLPGEVEAFLEAGEPPVYVGFGSMPMPAGLAEVIVSAARLAGRRVIVSSGRAGLGLAAPEPDCLVIGDVNLRRLFGRVAAVVHHGGAGTTTVAGLAGAPQVAVPQRFDQPYWARRVRDLGIGIAHAPGTPTADSLAAALGDVLRPGVAARARSVAAAMTEDGAQTAADFLSATAVLERCR